MVFPKCNTLLLGLLLLYLLYPNCIHLIISICSKIRTWNEENISVYFEYLILNFQFFAFPISFRITSCLWLTHQQKCSVYFCKQINMYRYTPMVEYTREFYTEYLREAFKLDWLSKCKYPFFSPSPHNLITMKTKSSFWTRLTL